MASTPKLVIVDRDGTLNIDSDDYVKSADEWSPYPNALHAIARLNHAGWHVVVVTNQSGLAIALCPSTSPPTRGCTKTCWLLPTGFWRANTSSPEPMRHERASLLAASFAHGHHRDALCPDPAGCEPLAQRQVARLWRGRCLAQAVHRQRALDAGHSLSYSWSGPSAQGA
ncbi:MAG: HAD-IIIA family hydrolase [Betaproteobacteria bacterium]|nr:HAD-IIIA family hydrolase [Betaproteobacteria bacterium]